MRRAADLSDAQRMFVLGFLASATPEHFVDAMRALREEWPDTPECHISRPLTLLSEKVDPPL